MKPEALCDIVIQSLEDMKGIDIKIMDVRSLTSITDYMIICTGRSTRHIKSLAESITVKAKEIKLSHIRTEGGSDSEWTLVDLGDVVVHITLSSARSFYSLEDLWEPVRELRENKNSS